MSSSTGSGRKKDNRKLKKKLGMFQEELQVVLRRKSTKKSLDFVFYQTIISTLKFMSITQQRHWAAGRQYRHGHHRNPFPMLISTSRSHFPLLR